MRVPCFFEVGGFDDESPIPRLKFDEPLLAMWMFDYGVVKKRHRIGKSSRMVVGRQYLEILEVLTYIAVRGLRATIPFFGWKPFSYGISSGSGSRKFPESGKVIPRSGWRARVPVSIRGNINRNLLIPIGIPWRWGRRALNMQSLEIQPTVHGGATSPAGIVLHVQVWATSTHTIRVESALRWWAQITTGVRHAPHWWRTSVPHLIRQTSQIGRTWIPHLLWCPPKIHRRLLSRDLEYRFLFFPYYWCRSWWFWSHGRCPFHLDGLVFVQFLAVEPYSLRLAQGMLIM